MIYYLYANFIRAQKISTAFGFRRRTEEVIERRTFPRGERVAKKELRSQESESPDKANHKLTFLQNLPKKLLPQIEPQQRQQPFASLKELRVMIPTLEVSTSHLERLEARATDSLPSFNNGLSLSCLVLFSLFSSQSHVRTPYTFLSTTDKSEMQFSRLWGFRHARIRKNMRVIKCVLYVHVL